MHFVSLNFLFKFRWLQYFKYFNLLKWSKSCPKSWRNFYFLSRCVLCKQAEKINIFSKACIKRFSQANHLSYKSIASAVVWVAGLSHIRFALTGLFSCASSNYQFTVHFSDLSCDTKDKKNLRYIFSGWISFPKYESITLIDIVIIWH